MRAGRKGHFARECRSPKDPRRPDATKPYRRTVLVETSTSNALVSQCDGTGSYDWSYQAEEEPANFALMTFQAHLLIISPTKPVQDLSHTTRPSAPIIEDWLSDSKTEFEPKAPQFIPSFAQSSEHVKSSRHTVSQIETTIPVATPAPASPKSNSSGQRRNMKACFVCKSVDHLIKDYNFHTKKMAQPTQRNYAHRGHHKLPVSTALPNITMTRPRHAHHIVTKIKSPIRRHITRSPSSKTSNSPPRVTTVQAPMFSAAQGNMSYLSEFEELNGGYVAFGGNPKGGKITGKGTLSSNYHQAA
nr:hypothetical protein [Tanacetum cinerariifolium]